MTPYVLDTSALFAYIENEDGASEVATILQNALDGRAEIFVSVVSYVEVFYVSIQQEGMDVAQKRLRTLDDLPMTKVPLEESLVEIVGEIKATRTMSFADCCVAGLAKAKEAILVHKDPEYEQVEDLIKQTKLPYKRTSK